MSRMLFFSCSKYSGEDERRNARQISPLSVDWMRDGGWHDAGFWVTFVDVGFLYRREVMRPLGRRLSYLVILVIIKCICPPYQRLILLSTRMVSGISRR